MKSLLILLLGITICANGVFAQMEIQGNVVNVGNMRVKKTFDIYAEHDGTAAGTYFSPQSDREGYNYGWHGIGVIQTAPFLLFLTILSGVYARYRYAK